MSFSVRSRNRSSGTRTCATCINDGCCNGLPSCGGRYWQNAYSTCDQCGEEFRDDGDWQSEDGHTFCSEECLDEWMLEHPNEEAEDGE